MSIHTTFTPPKYPRRKVRTGESYTIQDWEIMLSYQQLELETDSELVVEGELAVI